jgi:Leucine rich repeat
MYFLSTLIFIFSSFSLSLPQVCNKINCRYIQSNSNFYLNSDFINESNNFLPQQKSAKVSATKQKTKICVSFFSSNDIDRRDFEKMLDCSSIDLSGNEIKRVESNFFASLYRLESLNLDNNQLRVLPDNVFDELENLRKISVKNNFLESLDGDLFKFNFNLESVDFSNNKLSRISPQILDYSKQLKFASFLGNFCVDLTFPEVKLEELKAHITAMCSERNLITFIVSLMNLSQQFKNSAVMQKNQTLSGNETKVIEENLTTKNNQNESTTVETISIKLNRTNQIATKPKLKETPTDLDILIFSLFWLIVPIILILFAILTMISYAIYNKYFKYSLNYPRRNL